MDKDKQSQLFASLIQEAVSNARTASEAGKWAARAQTAPTAQERVFAEIISADLEQKVARSNQIIFWGMVIGVGSLLLSKGAD